MLKIKVSLKQHANSNNIVITKSALTHLQNFATRTTFTAQLWLKKQKGLILE